MQGGSPANSRMRIRARLSGVMPSSCAELVPSGVRTTRTPSITAQEPLPHSVCGVVPGHEAPHAMLSLGYLSGLLKLECAALVEAKRRHHKRIPCGRHQVVAFLYNLAVLAVVETEFLPPVIEVLEHFEAARLHPREHVHQTGLDTDRFLAVAFNVVREFVQAGLALALCTAPRAQRQRLLMSLCSRHAATPRVIPCPSTKRCGVQRLASLLSDDVSEIT